MGHSKNIKRLPREVRASLASTEVVRTNMVSGDGRRAWLHKVKLWDKPRALEVLAKHFRLLDDRLEVSSSAELMAKFAALDEGRARNAAAKDE